MAQIYNETEMLRLLSQGDHSAFATVYERYRRKVYWAAVNNLYDAALAEEVVQEVFLKLWRLRHNFEKPRDLNFSSYLATVTKNVIMDTLVKLNNKKKAEHEYASSRKLVDDRTDDSILTNQYDGLLEKAVGFLSPQQKQVYHLHKIEGMSQEAVARHLDISATTVNTHMRNALRLIRKIIGPYLN